METPARFIRRVIELSSGMQSGKYQPFRADTLFMHPYWNPPAIIFHRRRAVRFQRHFYLIAITGQMFVHGIVYNFVYEMVQTFIRNTADIHSWPFPDCFQSFQNRYFRGVIGIRFRHDFHPFLSLSKNSFCSIAYILWK